ncbi:hypothetical protein HPG69_012762 [Diceros bicornis minor]|uniref:Ig-like domain-containing protein n=1 Tax=Diceros bicornis minor TaxID=77932 RepID=A0A7J7EIT3_DICBM|nr:hypothetical protein HPG69_012762 [Diceros bicornis minor]
MSISLFDCGVIGVDSSLLLHNHRNPWGRMVDFPGCSLSGAVASFFILFITKQSDDFRVIGPAHPILARVGEDALLTCQLFPKRMAMHMEVRWYRSEPSTPVFAYRDGAEVTELQMEDYRGRIEWIGDNIAQGSVALKMYNIQPSDSRQYWCRFQEGNYCGETSLLLKVAVEATRVVRNASVETVSCFIHNHVLTEEKGSVISIPASLKVIGPSQPILVIVGEVIQLTCYLSPKANAQSMEVRWVRSHRYPAVYVYRDEDHVDGEQMAEYRGRTALVSDAINEGRLTLQIHNARTSDDGQYWCLFEKDGVYQEASLDLKIVGLGSSPLITMEGLNDGETQLMCTSEERFPRLMCSGGTWKERQYHHFQSHGLFHVETFLLVTNSSVVNVTCSISNPLLGEEKMATFSLSKSRMIFSWKILLLLGLLLAGTAGLIRRKSCKKVNETLNPNIGHPELILFEGNKCVTHGHSLSQMSHRDLMASSMSWARRGSCQGGGIERWRLGTGQNGSQVLPRTVL